MKKYLLAAAIPLALAACAQPRVWYRAGATQQDFYMDQGQCKAQGFGANSGTLLQIALIYNACMQGKGWTSVSAN
jgi:hypothetical protein